MLRSMYSGVSGLQIHQTKMDVIGNNIANVNTVGFKTSRVTFGEVFSQTLQSATGANENVGGKNPMQVGLGSTVSSIDVNMGEGGAQRTDNPLDLKIEGSGFFIVSDATGNKFSRAGAFRVDDAGNLVNPDGLNVMGWLPNDKQEIQKAKVSKLQILSPENSYVKPTATTEGNITGNINQNDAQLTNAGVPISMDIYDSLGYPYSVPMKITQQMTTGTPPAPIPNAYNIDIAANSITDSKGNKITNTAHTIPVTFDPATGKVNNATKTYLLDADNNATAPSTAGIITSQITAWGDPTNTAALPTAPFSEFSDITLDFSKITMFQGNTTVEAKGGNIDGIGAGNRAGSISGFEVSNNGQIVGRYTNGETKLLAQIAVANFENPAGLNKIGGNLFEATSNSGEFDGLGEDITSSGGKFNAGVLEMSNVDLSKEFTEMITTQRGFQANSRIISTSDEILQELVSLKR